MPKESDLVYNLVKFFNSHEHSFFHRTHGGIYTSMVGLPDILGCWRGRFVGIECKHIGIPKREKTPIDFKGYLTEKQLDTLNKIKDSDGISFVVFSFKNSDYIRWFDLEYLDTVEYTAGKLQDEINQISYYKRTNADAPPSPFPKPISWKLLKNHGKMKKNNPVSPS